LFQPYCRGANAEQGDFNGLEAAIKASLANSHEDMQRYRFMLLDISELCTFVVRQPQVQHNA
jgi:hypothetical protein